MMKLLSLLQKNLVWSIPIAMTFGLLYGYWFDAGPLKKNHYSGDLCYGVPHDGDTECQKYFQG